jgi:hypothetical protein
VGVNSKWPDVVVPPPAISCLKCAKGLLVGEALLSKHISFRNSRRDFQAGKKTSVRIDDYIGGLKLCFGPFRLPMLPPLRHPSRGSSEQKWSLQVYLGKLVVETRTIHTLLINPDQTLCGGSTINSTHCRVHNVARDGFCLLRSV